MPGCKNAEQFFGCNSFFYPSNIVLHQHQKLKHLRTKDETINEDHLCFQIFREIVMDITLMLSCTAAIVFVSQKTPRKNEIYFLKHFLPSPQGPFHSQPITTHEHTLPDCTDWAVAFTGQLGDLLYGTIR